MMPMVVIVNTCGFIDSAVQESPEAIGEALAENGKVIVTGCLREKKTRSVKCTRRCWKSPVRNKGEQVLANVRKYKAETGA